MMALVCSGGNGSEEGRMNHVLTQLEDQREALYNDRPTGPASLVQVPTERITALQGIVFDLDPKLYIPENRLFTPDPDPRRFYDNIRPVLDRHPLARSGEVRMTGTGLHVLANLSPAVELKTAEDQARWAAIVRAVQCTLPVDPDAPGITALTRAVGSVNSKNGAQVEVLRPGAAISPGSVEDYVRRLSAAPFKEVALPLLGDLRVHPCPVCQGVDSRLDVLDHFGKCYNGCSRVTLQGLYDLVFLPLEGVKR
jgi:hypothetical protein